MRSALRVLLSCHCYISSFAHPAAFRSEENGRVLLDIGTNVGERVASRLIQNLQPWLYTCKQGESSASKIDEILNLVLNPSKHSDYIAEPLLLLSIGNTVTNAQMLAGDLQEAGAEAYVIRKIRKNGVAVLAVNGNPMGVAAPRSSTYTDAQTGSKSSAGHTNLVTSGAITGAYAALEELGFTFLHPLEPASPAWLLVPEEGDTISVEVPRWAYRGLHIHTQHPLELTDVLQGFDIAPRPADVDSLGSEGETWESMLPEVESFLEWCAANRVNRVEWMLLRGPIKEDPESVVRQRRLGRLVALAHSYGILAGADVPIGLQQQHAWYMVKPKSKPEQQRDHIRKRCAWLAEAGFDFISSESGLSEFTNPGDHLMLELMNTFSTYVNGTLGLPASIKVHCSQGQTCSHHDDPRDKTGKTPLNFNFLPTVADPSLGVMPHTVQVYGLDDSTAGVYGNSNFEEMKDYLLYEAEQGARSVIYYGETAYWVSVDVDVPLFLPLYGERRLHDLRLLAKEEDSRNIQMTGQMIFDSGWEWGYWLNSLIAARAAWNPHASAGTDSDALSAIIGPILNRAFRGSRGPEESSSEERSSEERSSEELRKRSGSVTAAAVTDWLVRLCESQHKLLVIGTPNIEKTHDDVHEYARSNDTSAHNHKHSKAEEEQKKLLLTGMAYLSGSDTWLEVPRMLGLHTTQPDRVRMDEKKHVLYPLVAPLLEEMETVFMSYSSELASITSAYASSSENRAPSHMDLILEEFQDGVDMLVYRARQVRLLYAATSPKLGAGIPSSKQLLAESSAVLTLASSVVARREQHYRAPLQRIAAWREGGPTAYRFGYLWAVHGLYYWWRDQGVAEQLVADIRRGPCYLNRMDPVQVAFGWGMHTFQSVRETLFSLIPRMGDTISNCLAPPRMEYVFPRDLHRYSYISDALASGLLVEIVG